MDSCYQTNLNAKMIIPGMYRVPTVQIAIAGQDTKVLFTDGDSYFKLFYFEAVTDKDGATDVAPNNFSVRITLLSTGRMISNDFIPQAILAPKQFPIREPWAIEFPPNSQLQFEIKNLNAAAINLDLVLRGNKIFV